MFATWPNKCYNLKCWFYCVVIWDECSNGSTNFKNPQTLAGNGQGFLFPRGKNSGGGNDLWVKVTNLVCRLLPFGSSLISNVFLTILKISVGLLINSQVLLADGIHNAGDIIATFASLTSMRISKQPADEDHPYGHGKAEVIGSAIVAIILALAALYIAYEAVLAFFEEPAQSQLHCSYCRVYISCLEASIIYLYCTDRQARE